MISNCFRSRPVSEMQRTLSGPLRNISRASRYQAPTPCSQIILRRPPNKTETASYDFNLLSVKARLRNVTDPFWPRTEQFTRQPLPSPDTLQPESLKFYFLKSYLLLLTQRFALGAATGRRPLTPPHKRQYSKSRS